jgi:hypothetical protein
MYLKQVDTINVLIAFSSDKVIKSLALKKEAIPHLPNVATHSLKFLDDVVSP